MQPVRMELYRNGHLVQEVAATRKEDLRRPIEMVSGVVWLDAELLYLAMLAKRRDQITQTIRVCHSYEK